MEQKVLILGAKGMLGQALAEVYADQNPILWDRENLDVTNQKEVEKKLLELKPSLIINAAAYTDVDGAEENQDKAFKVNGEAVGYLAETAKKLGAILAHYSTDYVFDGAKKEGYEEEDKTDPVNYYGVTKLAGERELREKGEMFYLIRTSWMFGPNSQVNFIDKILKRAEETGELKVVNDQFGKPTYAPDLAAKTRKIIDRRMPCGIYHITNATKTNEGISWYEFAKKALEIKKLKAKMEPCCSDEFSTPATRPKHSSLINTKLEPMRSWESALEEHLSLE